MNQSLVLQGATKKATRRLVPLLALLLFVNYLDRVNIGFAASRMNADLGMSATAYGLGVALFFVGYIILEIPSNYFMLRLGARLWLARILITWGMMASLHAAVVGPTSFAAVRIFLGIAEAGFLPGVLLYLTLWFPVRVRAAVMGIYYIAVPLASALGGPLSEWLMVAGDGVFGLASWRFMFLVEGFAAVVLGVIVIFVLPSRPTDATWLTADERRALTDAVAADNTIMPERSHSFTGAFRDSNVITLAITFVLLVFPMFALSFFLPLVVAGMEETTGSLTHVQRALVIFVPYSLGAIASWLWSARNRNRDPQAWHYAAPAAVAGAGIIICAFSTESVPVLMAGVSVAAIGIYAAIPIFWGLTGRFVVGAAAASGLAIINSVGSLGGFAAGYLTGWLRDLTGNYETGFVIMGACLIASSALALVRFRHRLATTRQRIGDSDSPVMHTPH
nr:MFS transporter [Rhodococcus sp. (in: high G+C Gram-positive bacteria)]